MEQALKVEWIDSGREPKCAPDPTFPNGKPVDGSEPGKPSCETALPYPAKRCGTYIVSCALCGIRVGVTTAGRPDDPTSVKISCKQMAVA